MFRYNVAVSLAAVNRRVFDATDVDVPTDMCSCCHTSITAAGGRDRPAERPFDCHLTHFTVLVKRSATKVTHSQLSHLTQPGRADENTPKPRESTRNAIVNVVTNTAVA